MLINLGFSLKTRIKEFIKRHPQLLIFASIITTNLSISFFMLTLNEYFLVYYGDALSHLVIPRRIIDWITPALANLGGVWLPMTHLLLFPFVSIDQLFYSGYAGTIVSSIATAITAVMIYKIVKLQFQSVYGGMLSAALYFVNPAVMYMGMVPMMESVFMMFSIISFYGIQKFYYMYRNGSNIFDQYRTILASAFAITGACLTRYEGWVFPITFPFVLITIFMILSKEKWKRRIESILIISVPFGFVGIFSWIGWNFVIFRDMLYFATGPFSAKVQAAGRPFMQHLKFNVYSSLSIIVDVAKAMYGIPTLSISIAGLLAYLYMAYKKKALSFSILTILMFITPLMADFIAMLEGSGEIFPFSRNGTDGWFNGRYLMFLSPFFAFASTALVLFVHGLKKKPLTIITIILITASYSHIAITQNFEVGKNVALSDTAALLPFNELFKISLDTGKKLGKIYDEGKVAIISYDQFGQQIMWSSGIPLKNFIDAAAGTYWKNVTKSPWLYTDYLVLRTSAKSIFDPPNEPNTNIINYWNNNTSTLLQHYEIVYNSQFYQIMKIK
jgi:hypothetical protein